MAKQTLPTNFKDDILSPSTGGKRKYRLIDNGDDTYSFEDVTDYTQTGSDFGSGQINATNQAVNESCDKADVIDDLNDILANQADGKIAGAKAVKELNTNKEPTQKRVHFNNIYYKNGYNCFLHANSDAASDVIINLPENYSPRSAAVVSGVCRNTNNNAYYPCVGVIGADGQWDYVSALEHVGDTAVYYIYNPSQGIDRRSRFQVWLTGAWSTRTNGA